jgi:small subunit ribosomal protein S6
LREYECLLILPADADEALVGTATDRIQRVVAKHSGQVHGVDRWGRRRLAYEIDRRTEGYYVLVTFAAEPAAQDELDRTLNLADEVLRYKTTVLPRRPAARKPSDRKAAEPEAADEQAAAASTEAGQRPETSPAAVGGATPQGE